MLGACCDAMSGSKLFLISNWCNSKLTTYWTVRYMYSSKIASGGVALRSSTFLLLSYILVN